MSEVKLSDLLANLPEQSANKIYADVMKQQNFIPRSNEIFPKDNYYRAEPAKGTVELLSPNDEVLMRDGKVIEKRVEIKANKFYMAIEDL